MLLLGTLASLAIGLILGLLGGGGSILTVPLLVYLLDVDAHTAVAMSLFVVGATSLVAMVSHAHGGRVDWRAGLTLGVAGMAGARLGAFAGAGLPGQVLLLAFALLMAVTGVAMLRAHKQTSTEPVNHPVSALRAVGLGVGVGFISGLVGAGGGFLIVPALSLLGGLTLERAIGTSLLVLTLQSAAGFAGHVGHAGLDWTLTASLTLATIAGSLFGARLGRRVPQAGLRRAFATLVLTMAGLIGGRELGGLVNPTVGLVLALTLGLAGALLPLFHRMATCTSNPSSIPRRSP